MAIETSATQQSRRPRHNPENNNPIDNGRENLHSITLKIDFSGRNFNIVEKGKKMPTESVVRTSMTQFVFSWNTIQM
jgi:hypothetical protein